MAINQKQHRPLIEVLYVLDCPHAAEVVALAERVRAELGVDAELRTSLIGDQQAAERARFPGSPTVRVDGADIEPGGAAPGVSSLSCRLYRHEHGLSGRPAEHWLRDALLAATGTRPCPSSPVRCTPANPVQQEPPIEHIDADPPLPEPHGPVDPTVSWSPIEEVPRPGRFTLMAPGWIPPTHLVTQALGLCFTSEGLVVMVTWDGEQWSFPGGTVEDGESVQQALVREVAEEACARVVRCRYLASQHVADPANPDGLPSYYQTRWWARVELDPWEPRHEMTGRRLVVPDQVLDTLSWQRKQIAGRLLRLALDADHRDRAG